MTYDHKIIAFYLPQFHPIAENDLWWSKGFTEWHNVVQAKPLFPGHYQPNLPADLGFYDLRLSETREEQARIAKEYGVDGFCYWHYWFGNGKRLLDRPFSEVLSSGKPEFPFCLGWANHSWYKKDWGGKGKNELLIEQKYLGTSDYEDHFYAMLPAFKDSRYIRVAQKIFFIVHDPLGFADAGTFIQTWRNLATLNGLGDFYFVAKTSNNRSKDFILSKGFDAIYNDDVFNIHHNLTKIQKLFHLFERKILKRPSAFDYKNAIKYMVSEKDIFADSIPTIAPNWDHSPRSKNNAIILKNSKPELFKEVVKRALSIVNKKPKDQKVIILKSWNEWGEGNYMEPDMRFGYGFLNALKEGITEFYKNSINEE